MKKGLELLTIAQKVGLPSRANCGSCHFCGGGGDAVKHGDLDSTLIDPAPSHDVHMGGQDFTCQTCHVTTNHKIAGSSTTSAVSEGVVACTDCHHDRPHPENHPLLQQLNDHGDAIACQTCHIPRFATAKPTLMYWDWSKAGQEMKTSPEDPYCISIHHKKKGLLIKRKNVQPVYAWYNGKHRRVLAGDRVNLEGNTDLNPPVGDIQDPEARITPYKLHRAVQPADAQYGYLIIPKLWKGFWDHFDWTRAAAEGMRAAHMDFSGKIRFVNTTMHWRINHGVVPKSQALSCTHCHSPDGVMDFKALGYSGDPALSKGR